MKGAQLYELFVDDFFSNRCTDFNFTYHWGDIAEKISV